MLHQAFRRVARSLTLSRRLENRVRPLLDALTAATGLEVAMLTRLDAPRDRLEILWAHHAHQRGIVVAERSGKTWSSSYSRKACEALVAFTAFADREWPECNVLGKDVRTFMVFPVYDGEGEMFGTLCAVSSQRVAMSADASETIGTYARLIGVEVDFERLRSGLDAAVEQRRAEVLAEGARRMRRPERMVAELERVFALERHDEHPELEAG